LEAIDPAKIQRITKGRYRIERFNMRVGDEVWQVSINLTKKSVRFIIGDQKIILNRDQFQALYDAGPARARAAIKVALELDGDILDHLEASAYRQDVKHSIPLSGYLPHEADRPAVHAE
jgi:hypothetical protein